MIIMKNKHRNLVHDKSNVRRIYHIEYNFSIDGFFNGSVTVFIKMILKFNEKILIDLKHEQQLVLMISTTEFGQFTVLGWTVNGFYQGDVIL